MSINSLVKVFNPRSLSFYSKVSSLSSIMTNSMVLIIIISVCILMISVPQSEARIGSKTKEIDPRLLEDKFQSPSSSDISSGSGDIQPASDALQHFLKELDKYVAIAGRPRFGRSAYKARPLLSQYLLSRNLNELPIMRYLDRTD